MDSVTRFIESLKTRRIRKPTIAAVGTTLFSNVLAIVVMSTDYWERTDFYRLDTISNLLRNDSILDDDNGFYSLKLIKIKTQFNLGVGSVKPANNLNPNSKDNNNNNNNNNNIATKATIITATIATTTATTTHTTVVTTLPPLQLNHVVLRARSGGIWQICDHISDQFRSSSYFDEIVKSNPTFRLACYNYIRDYEKSNMTEKGIAIIRMQNSAVSCVIVCILCMVSSLCTGAFSIWREQVAVCMVTGVLNCVSGTFLCFALTIMTTKFKYMSGDCLTIDGPLPAEVCQRTVVQMSWSMALGWFSLLVIIWKAIMWLYLSRCYRLEKSKSIV